MPDIAGALAEPLSVAVRAERRSGGVDGKDVQIIGGGTIGILTALVTKARKPRSLIVCEPDPIKRKRAADMGFEARSPEEEGEPSDLVFECTGTDGGFKTAFEATRREAQP